MLRRRLVIGVKENFDCLVSLVMQGGRILLTRQEITIDGFDGERLIGVDRYGYRIFYTKEGQLGYYDETTVGGL